MAFPKMPTRSCGRDESKRSADEPLQQPPLTNAVDATAQLSLASRRGP